MGKPKISSKDLRKTPQQKREKYYPKEDTQGTKEKEKIIRKLR